MIIQSAVFDGFEYGFKFKWLEGSHNLLPVLVQVISPLFADTIDLEIRQLLDGKSTIAEEILNSDSAEQAVLQELSKSLSQGSTS